MTEVDDTTNEVVRRCNKCGKEFPATAEYFHRRGLRLLRRECKFCNNARKRQWEINNPEKARETSKSWRQNNRERVRVRSREYAKVWRKNNPDRANDASRKWQQNNREKSRANTKAWRSKNFDKSRAYRKRYHAENRDKRNAESKLYRKNNLEKMKGLDRAWAKRNPDKVRVKASRRRAIKRGLPNTFCVTDWNNVLEYFEDRCAYCGNQQGLLTFTKFQQDHFIPLTSLDCPGTVPENIVPACADCNNNKRDQYPHEWIVSRFGERNAREILTRIERYFEMVKQK